jgi:hypothetical protein
MFSYVAPNGSLGIRLPKEAREQYLKTYHTTLIEAYGTVIKEYVAVPHELLQNTQELAPYFAASFAYVNTLKPKPQTKGKRATPPPSSDAQ